MVSLKEILRKYNFRNIVILFSGGKDSLVTMHRFLREYESLDYELKEKIKKLLIVHIDTGIGVHECKEYVKEVLENLPYEYKIIRPITKFEQGVRKWGLPFLHFYRWCMHELKQVPLSKLFKDLGSKCTLCIYGIRCNESNRRFLIYGKYINEKFFSFGNKDYTVKYCYAPCIDFDEKDVNRYIEKYDLKVNPVSKILGISGECLCNFHIWSRKKQMMLKAHFPDSYDMITRIIENARLKGRMGREVQEMIKKQKKQKTLDDFIYGHR